MLKAPGQIHGLIWLLLHSLTQSSGQKSFADSTARVEQNPQRMKPHTQRIENNDQRRIPNQGQMSGSTQVKPYAVCRRFENVYCFLLIKALLATPLCIGSCKTIRLIPLCLV